MNNIPSSNDDTNTSLWDSYRGIIRTRKGGWKMGEGVYCHGFNMLEDLVQNCSIFQIMILNATGRLPEPQLGKWFEAVQGCVSWPDPRIWCNQMGALAGSLRCSPAAGIAAGIMAADSKIYGPQTIAESMKFFQRALAEKKTGISAEEIVSLNCKKHNGKPKIMGFARPIAKGDERIPVLEKVADRLGFETGEHLALAYELDEILTEKFDESMNVSGYVAAFLADQNFTPWEIYVLTSAIVSSGITACYIDAYERPAETFLPLRCDDIDYKGPPLRPVPDRE